MTHEAEIGVFAGTACFTSIATRPRSALTAGNQTGPQVDSVSGISLDTNRARHTWAGCPYTQRRSRESSRQRA